MLYLFTLLSCEFACGNVIFAPLSNFQSSQPSILPTMPHWTSCKIQIEVQCTYVAGVGGWDGTVTKYSWPDKSKVKRAQKAIALCVRKQKLKKMCKILCEKGNRECLLWRRLGSRWLEEKGGFLQTTDKSHFYFKRKLIASFSTSSSSLWSHSSAAKLAKWSNGLLEKHRHRRNVTSHHSLSHLSLLHFNFFNFHHKQTSITRWLSSLDNFHH